MNILRKLLDRAEVVPADVALLDRHHLERAPGVGKHSLEIIGAWLRSHGLELQGGSVGMCSTSVSRHQKKLLRVIDYLEHRGYEVRRIGSGV